MHEQNVSYAYKRTVMKVADMVARVRAESGLSVRALAKAAGVATSTLHRIEHDKLQPTVATLKHIVEAAGMRLEVEPHLDQAVSIVGLARSIRPDIAGGKQIEPVRKAAELTHRFQNAELETQVRTINAEPPETGDVRWDAFLAALAEWLSLKANVPVPMWSRDSSRYLTHGWWVTTMKSMRAWEYAGTPASFQIHGVYIHRDSLTNI